MPAYRVTLAQPKDEDVARAQRRLQFVNFSCNHLTVEALTKALNAGIVFGERLHTIRNDDLPRRPFVVCRRSPFSLTKHVVASIRLLPVEMYDERGIRLDAEDPEHTERRADRDAADHVAYSRS